jgi:hypothetical protein
LGAIGSALVERFENRYWSAELHRLRGAFLTAMGAEEAQIEASFGEAIRIAKEQKSVSLAKRAAVTHAEYHRQVPGIFMRGYYHAVRLGQNYRLRNEKSFSDSAPPGLR